MRTRGRRFLGTVLVVGLVACGAEPPSGLGVDRGRLASCPVSPNCVSSDSEDPASRVQPLRVKTTSDEAWQVLVSTLRAWPRVTIVTVNDRYMHAESHSLIFGFVDDLEFHRRPDAGIIALRSAARLGYSDFGVNGRRIQALRRRLQAAGVIG